MQCVYHQEGATGAVPCFLGGPGLPTLARARGFNAPRLSIQHSTVASGAPSFAFKEGWDDWGGVDSRAADRRWANGCQCRLLHDHVNLLSGKVDAVPMLYLL